MTDTRRFIRRTDALRRVSSAEPLPVDFVVESFDVRLIHHRKRINPDDDIFTFRWSLDGKPRELMVQHRSEEAAWALLAKDQGWTR